MRAYDTWQRAHNSRRRWICYCREKIRHSLAFITSWYTNASSHKKKMTIERETPLQHGRRAHRARHPNSDWVPRNENIFWERCLIESLWGVAWALPTLPDIFANCTLQRWQQSLASPTCSLKNCTYVHIYFAVAVGRLMRLFAYHSHNNMRSYYQPQQEHMECFPLVNMYHTFLAKHYKLPFIGWDSSKQDGWHPVLKGFICCYILAASNFSILPWYI